ncbi:uncharacterized protein LAESUDRAFT_663257 [Laetiporus sulphureus 93-53]|uniref:Uncharacterized protein n=1 Tax=Laetiporus sulphureus 93-53 TaxID=1314785 RepID=A0A165BWB9_9APHY|nr:uncharacterized protein LAESUDRAFT_663257 [Laetiporus sulphureus 93-53]KZT01769.1 hypothetical protein LAESUDRAFT_663257 [Laetiporus sulphureus 93-53]
MSTGAQRQHTYIAEDYLLEYPIDHLDPVTMTLHESVHFSLNLTDPIVDMEWESLAAHPGGFGRTQLGPDHCLFVLTFYHQLHCLWKFQSTLINRNDPGASPHHVQHCLNYLHQLFLCDAATTLELGDFMVRDFEQNRVGDTLVCRDWEKVYNVLDSAFVEWSTWSVQWN